MSEIRINIDDKYLQAFLTFLETLNYVHVEQVTPQTSRPKGKAKAANAT